MLVKIWRAGLAAMGLMLLITGPAFAQSPSMAVSLSGGVVASPKDPCQRRPDFLFYPEIQVEAKFATFGNQALSARGAVYYGHWDDGADATTRQHLCSDSNTIYSLSEHVAGTRLLIAGEEGFVPVVVSIGLARHFAFSDYITGTSWGSEGHDSRSAFTSAEVGLHVRIPIAGRFMLQGGARRYVDFPPHQHIIGAFLDAGLPIYQIGLLYQRL